jgi:hypothetical protein
MFFCEDSDENQWFLARLITWSQPQWHAREKDGLANVGRSGIGIESTCRTERNGALSWLRLLNTVPGPGIALLQTVF